MNECICGKIISAKELYCHKCGEEIVLSLKK